MSWNEMLSKLNARNIKQHFEMKCQILDARNIGVTPEEVYIWLCVPKRKIRFFLDLNNFPSPLLPSSGCSWSDSVENFGHRMHLIRVQNFIKLLHGNKMNFIQSTFLSKLWFWPFLYNFCIILVKFNRTKHFLYNICIVVWLKSTKKYYIVQCWCIV